MLKRTSPHLGLAIGLLALVIALGAPSWAARLINGATIKAGTVASKQVKDSSLTGRDLRNGSVGSPDLATGAVRAPDLADDSVTTPKFAPSAVAPLALGLPGLTTVPGESPSIVGGFEGNTLVPAIVGATLLGGGLDGRPQSVTGSFGTVVGGQGNTASEFSFAAGRRAQATNTGSFVWADSTNSDFSSSADNQFAIRAANGMVIANDAGGSKAVPVGTRYADNAIVAWARVTAAGVPETSFNVESVTKVSTGQYRVVLRTSLTSGFSLVPVVTPELDQTAPDTPPVGAANVRFAATNQVVGGSTFDVYIYNGSFALADNDFQFLVTGR